MSSKCANKKCHPDTVCNPASGRCVSKTGAIGRRLLKGGSATPAASVSTTAKCADKKCDPDTVCNPASGRCVSKTGAIGRRLLKGGNAAPAAPRAAPAPAPAPRAAVAVNKNNIKNINRCPATRPIFQYDARKFRGLFDRLAKLAVNARSSVKITGVYYDDQHVAVHMERGVTRCPERYNGSTAHSLRGNRGPYDERDLDPVFQVPLNTDRATIENNFWWAFEKVMEEHDIPKDESYEYEHQGYLTVDFDKVDIYVDGILA